MDSYEQLRQKNLKENKEALDRIMKNMQPVEKTKVIKKKKPKNTYHSSAKPSNDGSHRELRTASRIDYRRLADEE